MIRFISRVTRIVTSPLRVGNPVIGSNGNLATDGKTSSTVLVACVLPITFVIIITFSVEPSVRQPSPLSWGITELMFGLGSLSSIFLSISAYKRTPNWIAGPCDRDISQKPRLIFFWLFGFCVIVYAALNLSINIDCIMKNGPEPFPGEQSLSVVSHVVEIVFFASQLGFIAYFIKFRFFTSVLLNYGMSAMLMTHLVVWFHSVVSSLFRNHIIVKSNFTMLNKTDCFWQSDINVVRKQLAPYVAPAQTEYSLLSASFLLKMWSVVNEMSKSHSLVEDVQSRNEVTESTRLLPQNYARNVAITEEEAPANVSSMNIRINSYNSTLSRSDNLDSTDITEDEFSQMKDALQITNRPREKVRLSFYIMILVGIALTVPVLVALMIVMTVRQSSSRMHYILAIIETIFTCAHLSFLVVAFVLLRKQCILSASQQLTSKHHILILSASGSVAFSTFTFLSGVFFNSSDIYSNETASVVIFAKIVDIIGVYLQTTLIIYSGRCNRQNKESTSVFRVENCFLLLLITNFVSWFSHSFLASQLSSETSDHHRLSSSLLWPVINEVIFPFVIFFRFHSFMDMYERYREFKIPVSEENVNKGPSVRTGSNSFS